MPRNPYTSLSIDRLRYAKLSRDFETISSEDSFTEWHTKTAEAAIQRVRMLKKLYPNLKVVKRIENGVIIDDSKRNDVVKVTYTNNKLQCSEKDGIDYIIFAALSPEFNPA